MAFQDERIKGLPSEDGPWPGLKVHDKESRLGKCLGTQHTLIGVGDCKRGASQAFPNGNHFGNKSFGVS
jgi:hypothetical protein